MIGMPATDIVQEVQSEVDAGATMRIEAGSREMKYTRRHCGSADGRDRGQWGQGMMEMKSDVEWADTYLHMHHSQHLLASRVPRVFDPILIKAAELLSARCALVVIHSMVCHRVVG